MAIHCLFNVGLWDRAYWRGVVLGGFPDKQSAPFIGFLFDNNLIGRKVFEGIRNTTGQVDNSKLISLSIIEGDIPGKEPGYSIIFGHNPSKLLDVERASGGDPSEGMLMLAKIHRMNPEPHSPNLPRFKNDYKQHQSANIFPCSFIGGRLILHQDLAIEIFNIDFVAVDAIEPGDYEYMAVSPT